MITYIFKAILFSALLLLIYRLFLEKEKMHRFNRFYLLMSIILPFAVPLVPIETGSPLLSAFKSIIPAVNKLPVTDLTGSFLPVALTDKSSTGNSNSSNNISSNGNKSISRHESNSTSRHSIDDTNSQYDNVPRNSRGITGANNHNKTLNHNEGITLHGNLSDKSNNNRRVAGGSFWNINQKLLSNLLLFVYLSITTSLFLRFSGNIIAFRKKIKQNRSVPYREAKLVLTREIIIPYSFLNYIFVNEQEFRNNTIEPAVLGHELVHIRQKHTLDILFFELVRIIGWINPLLPLYGNAIRLNHEFLADECVVKKYCDPATYQMLLFEKIRQENNLILSSPFNFIMTKKRMIMMSKKASPGTAFLKQIAIIPLIAAAGLLFTAKGCSEDLTGTLEQQHANTEQDGESNWQLVRRTNESGNVIKEIFGEFEGKMYDNDVSDAPVKIKIFVTKRKGGEMFTEFYESGSETPVNLHKSKSPAFNYTTQSFLPVKVSLYSGEIIEMGQTAGGSHMWDFNFPPPGTPNNPIFSGSRFGNLLSIILEQHEKMSVMVDFRSIEEFNNKIYRFDINPAGLKEFFAKL